MEQLPSLLGLPRPVRRRIYDFVGLVSSSRFSPYKIDLHGRPVDGLEPGTFHGLLLSCRTVHAEVAAIVYSGNLFVLRYDPAHPDPLRPLHALTATSLAALTSLTIVLNQASCHQHYTCADSGECCVEGRDGDWSGLSHCKRYHRDSHQLPLLSRRPACRDVDDDLVAAAQDLLAKWRLAAACLSSVPARHLELALVCDIDPRHKRASEFALGVTAPLRLRLLPRLKDCHIRLSKTPDAPLQQIAWDGALQACRVAPPPYRFPKPSARAQATLTGLPRELRLRILEYTDLIAPGRQVTWSRQDQGYLTSARDSHCNEDVNAFYHCWDSRPLSTSPSFIGCFCRRRHAACSFRCRCWAPPSSLFLVCRTLHQDAQLTFFSGNRFIVHDYKAHPPWALPSLREFAEEGPDRPEGPEGPEGADASCYDYPADRFAASQFLREVVPTHCLPHLRFLELVFPPYLAQTWPRRDHPVMQDWRTTIDWLLDKINAPALTLRLCGAEVSYMSPPVYHKVIPMADGFRIAEAHSDLARPLKALGEIGLARFFFHFPCPWEFTMAPDRRDQNMPRIEAKKREFKAAYERRVMGERFDTLYENGREEPKLSLWHWAYDLL